MTPTGADAMKEAERLVENLRSWAWDCGHLSAQGGSRAAEQKSDEAEAALLAFIRKLVEAQPAAVAGEAERADAKRARPPSDEEPWVVADNTGLRVTFRDEGTAWRYRDNNTDRLDSPTVTYEPATAAPAAPLVGEPRQQPVAFYEQEPHGQSYKLFWTVPGLGVPAGAVPLYASPAAPAGVPTQPDMLAVCAALGFDPTNHHNAAKCPYCRCDSSEASGSAIPARPTLPSDERIIVEARRQGLWIVTGMDNDNEMFVTNAGHQVIATVRALLAGGDQKADPLHPSIVQAVDGTTRS